MALLMFEIIRYTIFYKKKFDVNDPVALKHKVSFSTRLHLMLYFHLQVIIKQADYQPIEDKLGKLMSPEIVKQAFDNLFVIKNVPSSPL